MDTLTVKLPRSLKRKFSERARKSGRTQSDLAREWITQLLPRIPNLTFVEEIIEFLGQGPQPEEIVAFHVSEKSQERVRALLDKNRAGNLTPEEEAEMDAMESLNHLFALIKARAWQHLSAAS